MRSRTAETSATGTPGWSLGVHCRGQGKPVVLLHGLLTDSRVWDPLVDELARDHLTIAVDAPGHGQSPSREAAYTLEQEVAATAARYRSLCGDRPAIWIGHSMGGMKALRLALAHPALARGLVLISTQPYAEPVNTARPFEAMVETVLEHGMSADLAQMIARLNFAPRFRGSQGGQNWERHFTTLTGPGIAQACYSVYRRGDLSDRLAELRLPVLVIHGQADVPIRIRVARQYAAALPDARLVELPGVGHTPPCENPGEVRRAVRAFVDVVPG